jgi:hypothetical protein
MEQEEEEYLYDISSEEIQVLPLAHFEGPVMLIENPDDVAAAVDAICRAGRVGFDTESRPSFRRGEHYPVCLIQVATHACVYLFRINKTGLTPELRAFLADEQVQKIGVGLGRISRVAVCVRQGGFCAASIWNVLPAQRFKKPRCARSGCPFSAGADFQERPEIKLGTRNSLTETDHLCRDRCLDLSAGLRRNGKS